jgi:pyruvate dehydrogenase E2 component (dihydrolipoamide acetyltransferase)
MDHQVLMPQLGNEIEEAQVDAWLKTVGDHVEAGDQLVAVTTPKVTIEIEAPVGGTLKEILVEADELASVGAVLALIET